MESKGNKNIDQLFKQRLQGMESTPPPAVWANIQEELGHNKRDRKVIPLWWKLGGVAAALVLLFAVSNMFISENPDNHILNDDSLVNEVETKFNSQKTNDDYKQEKTLIEEVKTDSEFNNTVINSQNTNVANKPLVNKDAFLPKKDVLKTKKHLINSSVANIVTTNTNNTLQKNITIANSKSNIAKNTIAKNNPVSNQITTVVKGNESNIVKDVIAVKEGVVITESNKLKEELEEDKIIDTEKESIFDAIDEQKEAVAKTTDDMPADRWAISPNVAPVYYNTLRQGSSIDPSFSDNTQNGEVNMSYGINVSYALSPRLTVRSGVSSVNLSYATGGLDLATGDASVALQAVTFNDTGIVVTAVDQGALNNVEAGSPFEKLTKKSTSGDVSLTQNISYTEIPAELTYALVNKKLGINLIGGFSTLLLGNNEVSVTANDFENVLGEANNLSDVSFSTNVGLGLSYQLSRKFKFNVEPMFKYQLNPYTDNSVQFKPYYVGVYSGLSFKF